MEIERMKRDLLILTPVEKLPKREHNPTQQHDMIGILNGFMAMSAKIAQVQFGGTDFANVTVAYQCIFNAVKLHGYPVKVCIRNGGLYLIKKNIT